jgi:predicted lipoprotein with Yx(FWY)xxD motif
MRRSLVVVLVGSVGCQDHAVPDSGGRSLQVPVPSSGVAATTKGPERDLYVFPKRTKRDPSALDVRSGSRGAYIVDAAGLAVYGFSEDAQGQSACGANCAAAWPPVIVDELPSAKNSAIDATKLGIVMRPDGSRQLSYGGMPLYYSDSDVKPDDTWGHYAMSFGGHFALVGADGKPLPAPK